MDGPRAPHDAEIPGVLHFLNSELRSREGWSIAAEYPAAFSPVNLGNIRIIKNEQNELLSHAVMRPMLLKTPAGLFKVAAIGSVVTSTAHRNQGFSRQIIESCLEAAETHACDFAILWTDLFDFYRKMGFELGGCEISLAIEKEFSVSTEGLKILDSAKVSAEAIHRVYSQHTVSSLRSLEDTSKYLQIPNMRVYTAWDANGVLKAYAIEGKGADLNGYIHEWGGGVSALLALFSHIRKAQNRRITVICPRHSQNLIRQLCEKGAMKSEGFLGMIKLLKTENLFAKIKRHSRALGVADVILEKRSDGFFYFGTPSQVFKTDSELDMVRLLFGPQKPSEMPGLDKEAALALERFLPIDAWVWGWDSI
jgi:GNAT superfamily N-acetyltransferase